MTDAVRLEWCGLARDYMQLAQEYGTPITVRVRREADVSRDSLGAVKMRTASDSDDVSTYALPVERGPDERRLHKLGLREECDAAVQMPAMAFYPLVDVQTPEALGDTWSGLDLNRMTVELDGMQYKVADKGMPVRYGDRPVAFSLGLRRN